MNILYISALEGGKYTGPIYSVPNQIEAQSKIDNVYWVNLTQIDKANIKKGVECHMLFWKDFSLDKLPHPFDKPHLVVFEEFFKIENYRVYKIVNKSKLPYVIVPRGSMTYQYLEHKKMTKLVASVLLFNKFKNNAMAVQFLTTQEQQDSKQFYNKRSILVPNGIHLPEHGKKITEKNKIVGTFIGRYSIVQKGLDILLEAIYRQKELLERYKVRFDFYGPDERSGSHGDITALVEKYKLNDMVSVNGPVFDEEKAKVLEKSDFFIHTSRFEGLPMAVLEALAYGVPCLVTEGSNVRNEIESFDAGWGADTNVEGVEKALIQMTESLGKIESFSSNAVLLAEKYSWDSIAEDTHNKYEELLV